MFNIAAQAVLTAYIDVFMSFLTLLWTAYKSKLLGQGRRVGLSRRGPCAALQGVGGMQHVLAMHYAQALGRVQVQVPAFIDKSSQRRAHSLEHRAAKSSLFIDAPNIRRCLQFDINALRAILKPRQSFCIHTVVALNESNQFVMLQARAFDGGIALLTTILKAAEQLHALIAHPPLAARI